MTVFCSTPAAAPCDLSPPGAAIATCGPHEEYGASFPPGPVADTAMHSLNAAG